MKVFITGGMGVMGAEVSRIFVREGVRPVIFARHRDESLIGDILDKVDIELGDINDLPCLLHAIKKHQVTHIIHAGGLVSALAHANPPLGVQVNVVGYRQCSRSRAPVRYQTRRLHQRQRRLRFLPRRIRAPDLQARHRGLRQAPHAPL